MGVELLLLALALHATHVLACHRLNLTWDDKSSRKVNPNDEPVWSRALRWGRNGTFWGGLVITLFFSGPVSIGGGDGGCVDYHYVNDC